MNTAIITLKTNPQLKNQAMKIADELGFSLSSLINSYLKTLVRTKSVSVSLNDESRPSQFMIDGLRESAEDIKAGRVSPGFTDINKAVEWLKSDNT